MLALSLSTSCFALATSAQAQTVKGAVGGIVGGVGGAIGGIGGGSIGGGCGAIGGAIGGGSIGGFGGSLGGASNTYGNLTLGGNQSTVGTNGLNLGPNFFSGAAFAPDTAAGRVRSGGINNGTLGNVGNVRNLRNVRRGEQSSPDRSRTEVISRQVRHAVQNDRTVTTTGKADLHKKTVTVGGAKGATVLVDPDPEVGVTTGDGADGGIAAGTVIPMNPTDGSTITTTNVSAFNQPGTTTINNSNSTTSTNVSALNAGAPTPAAARIAASAPPT